LIVSIRKPAFVPWAECNYLKEGASLGPEFALATVSGIDRWGRQGIELVLICKSHEKLDVSRMAFQQIRWTEAMIPYT
jgi:hypothetical protein